MQEGPLLGGPSNTNSLLSVVAVAAIGRIVADVHPAIIGYPLDTRFVAVSVTTVVRQRGGQCDASAYAPGPETSTAPMAPAPIASPPVAGPITSACPSNSARTHAHRTSEPARTGESHSPMTGNGHGASTTKPAHARRVLPRRNRQKRPPLGSARRRSRHFST